MAAIPIFSEGEIFYVPHYEVKLSGSRLPDDIVRDVMQVTYKDSMEEMDSFEMTINNWDAAARKFKYEPPSQSDYEKIFDPGKKIELSMGYMHNMRLLIKGEITTLEPNFADSGGSTLSVRGLNELFSFRKKQHTWAWPETQGATIRDSDIAQEIGRQPVSDRRPGLGIEVRVSDQARGQENAETFVFMNNQYDIIFLLERARRHRYSVYLDIDGETGEQFLYFGPSELLRDVTYELEWGKSLIQFRPTLTTTNQIEQVTVRGWNRRTRRPIEGTAKIPDDCRVNSDQQAVARAVQGRHEVITDRPVYTPQDAKSLAKSILCGQLQEMVKASGATVGLPDLRAGSKVNIKNLGPRFDGQYFVTQTTHTINDSGYRTTFEARREGPLEGST